MILHVHECIWIVPSFHCCSNSEWKVFQPWNVQEIYFTVGGKTNSHSAKPDPSSFQWDTWKLPGVVSLFWFNNFEFSFQPRIVFFAEFSSYCPLIFPSSAKNVFEFSLSFYSLLLSKHSSILPVYTRQVQLQMPKCTGLITQTLLPQNMEAFNWLIRYNILKL